MPLAKAFLAIAAMALVTFGTRGLSFLLFRNREPPRRLSAVLASIPPAVMTILALSCFKEVRWARAPYGVPELSAALLVALLHLWKRNAFLSIFGGTAFYMLLVRTGLLGLVVGG